MVNYHMGAGGQMALVGGLLAVAREDDVGLQLGKAIHLCEVVEKSPARVF